MLICKIGFILRLEEAANKTTFKFKIDGKIHYVASQK